MGLLVQYFRTMFEHHPLRLVFWLTLALFPVVLLLAWVNTGRWAHDRTHAILAEQTVVLAERQRSVAQDFDNALKLLRGLPDYLADDSVVVGAVASRDRQQLHLVNQFFARYAASFGVDVVYAMDAAGECLAASNYDQPESFIGQNYADRRYFTEALFSQHGSQYAVGRVTNVPGFFFSSPIFDHGRRVGVMAIKINAPKFERRVRLQNTLVADEQGVIVMADNPEHQFRLLPGAALNNQPGNYSELRYKRIKFDALALAPAVEAGHPDLYLLDGRLVLLLPNIRVTDSLFLYLYAPVSGLEELPGQRRLLLITSILGGTAAAWAAWATLIFFLRARAYQHRIEHANEALSHMNRVLQQQATHDALTGCLNRRALNELLENELLRAKRYILPLSVAMLDIDHFKRINDEYGHAVGDQALRHLSDQVSSRIRQCDIFVRYGGEEFLLVMPGTTLDDAVVLLDRIRNEIKKTVVPAVLPPLCMTFSAGVVGHASASSVAELLARVDAAMYQAKQAGRDRVVADRSPVFRPHAA